MPDAVNVVVQIKELMDGIKERDHLINEIMLMIESFYMKEKNMGDLPVHKTPADYAKIKREWKGTDFTPQED